MTTIRLSDVSKTFSTEQQNNSRYGSVLSFSTNITSRSTANEYRQGLQSASRPPEPHRPQAVFHVNLEIRSGETLGLLGPSGCGKTTLLKLIAGLIQPDSGLITYDGQDMTSILPGERRIGVVFQDYALYPHMASAGNIGFFFRVHNRQEEIPERVRQVSEIMGVGFDQLLSRKPPTLSGGERQRVAVARCIARDPSVFLFDEPLSNLDAKLRVQTRHELKRLLDRFHVTGLYVTHDQIEAIALCDRLAIMRDGQIEQVGTFTRLMENPVNTFVAGFLGMPPMNLFEGRWSEEGWIGRDFNWPLPPIMRHTALIKGTLGIRPQHVILNDDQPLTGIVSLVEPLISERVVIIHLDSGHTTIVARVAADSPFATLKLGESVHFGFETDQAILFDGVSGKRF